MCTGCIQSGLEFAATGSVALAAGLRHAGLRARDRLRPESAADRRARSEARTAAFLAGLDLDPGAILGGATNTGGHPAVGASHASGADELQPA